MLRTTITPPVWWDGLSHAWREGGDHHGRAGSRAAGARRLRDKVCVVTGAGQGIGRATAGRLGEEGGKIVVAERIDERDQDHC